MTPLAMSMDPLGTFLRPLLEEGRVVVSAETPADTPVTAATVAILDHVFRAETLDLAGPPLAFDAAVAVGAARVFREACRAVYDPSQDEEELARRLTWEAHPESPDHHLAADLVFRFLPQVYRRARAVSPLGPLPTMLQRLLADWPLSGVLAALDDGPSAPPDLGEHPGIGMLYAERFLRREHPKWRPVGRGLEWLEIVRPAPRDAPVGRSIPGGSHD